MSNPVCEICGKAIAEGQRFIANRDGQVWTVEHDACIDPRGPYVDYPRFVMSSARAWVLTKKNG